MAKYNICIPVENPQSNKPNNRYRMCSVYQTEDVDECLEELAGYLLDHFPANIEVKGTTEEEDQILMQKLQMVKHEVEIKMGVVPVPDDNGKKS